MSGYDFWCDSCDFNRQGVSGRNYVTEENGVRHLYLEEDESFQTAIRIFQDSSSALESADSESEAWELFKQTDGGTAFETACFECGHLWHRDSKSDPLKCPDCDSKTILEVHQLQNRPCPLCRSGTIQSNQPDLFQ